MSPQYIIAARMLAGAIVALFALPFWVAGVAFRGSACAFSLAGLSIWRAANWIVGE